MPACSSGSTWWGPPSTGSAPTASAPSSCRDCSPVNAVNGAHPSTITRASGKWVMGGAKHLSRSATGAAMVSLGRHLVPGPMVERLLLPALLLRHLDEAGSRPPDLLGTSGLVRTSMAHHEDRRAQLVHTFCPENRDITARGRYPTRASPARRGLRRPNRNRFAPDTAAYRVRANPVTWPGERCIAARGRGSPSASDAAASGAGTLPYGRTTRLRAGRSRQEIPAR